MSIYLPIRNWVDRTLRSARYDGVLLPGFIPLLLGMFAGSAAIKATCIGCFAMWCAFVAWRWWIYMREASAAQDKKFDKRGKYKLGKEYLDTESATATRQRKGK